MSAPGPRTADGRAAVTAMLAAPERTLLALDFDGTLSPVVGRPEQARSAPGAVAVLTRLASVLGTVAVVTGRPAADVVALGGLSGVPGLRVFGHYGLERWRDGRLDTPEPHPGVQRLREPLRRLVAAAPSGTALEDKGHSLAVHTRRTADPPVVLARLRGPVQALADEAGLQVVPGRHVLELRPSGSDKGGVLRELVTELDPAVVGFCGDDVGDLPAVEAVRSLRAGDLDGFVVAVASDEGPAELIASADLVVDSPAGLVALLESWADALDA